MLCIELPNFWFVNSNSRLRLPNSRCKSVCWCCKSLIYPRSVAAIFNGFGLCRADRPYSSSSRYRPRSSDRSRERSLGSRIGINSRSCTSTKPPRSNDWYRVPVHTRHTRHKWRKKLNRNGFNEGKELALAVQINCRRLTYSDNPLNVKWVAGLRFGYDDAHHRLD